MAPTPGEGVEANCILPGVLLTWSRPVFQSTLRARLLLRCRVERGQLSYVEQHAAQWPGRYAGHHWCGAWTVRVRSGPGLYFPSISGQRLAVAGCPPGS
jgi:hypothetical protein